MSNKKAYSEYYIMNKSNEPQRNTIIATDRL